MSNRPAYYCEKYTPIEQAVGMRGLPGQKPHAAYTAASHDPICLKFEGSKENQKFPPNKSNHNSDGALTRLFPLPMARALNDRLRNSQGEHQMMESGILMRFLQTIWVKKKTIHIRPFQPFHGPWSIVSKK